ncbi:MAG: endonuclease/exonuclease/phosphatase family protein [Pseudoxanthomonas sp.]
MLRFAVHLLAGLALAGIAFSAQAVAPLRVMSFNVRVPVASDGPDRWEARREQMAGLIAAARPDVIGTQELVAGQGDYLVEQLPRYAWFGAGRRGDGGDEHMGVFYRKDSLRLVESGDFWLSDTPEIPGSISWGNLYPRLVTWGLFERKADGLRFYLLNTHLPYRDEDGPARERAAQLIQRWLAHLPAGAPVVLTGDFNDLPGSSAYQVLTGVLRDAWLDAPRRDGPGKTFHAFTGKAEKRIDWVLYRGLKPLRASTLTGNENGRYPSDHFPVLVEFDFRVAE